jgi:hypothetical protein
MHTSHGLDMIRLWTGPTVTALRCERHGIVWRAQREQGISHMPLADLIEQAMRHVQETHRPPADVAVVRPEDLEPVGPDLSTVLAERLRQGRRTLDGSEGVPLCHWHGQPMIRGRIGTTGQEWVCVCTVGGPDLRADVCSCPPGPTCHGGSETMRTARACRVDRAARIAADFSRAATPGTPAPCSFSPPGPISSDSSEAVTERSDSDRSTKIDLAAGFLGTEVREIDRNARAYGWEVGRRGIAPPPAIASSPDNPFLDSGWRGSVE